MKINNFSGVGTYSLGGSSPNQAIVTGPEIATNGTFVKFLLNELLEAPLILIVYQKGFDQYQTV